MYTSYGRHDSVISLKRQKMNNWLQKFQAVVRPISGSKGENVVFIPKSSNQYDFEERVNRVSYLSKFSMQLP